MIAYLLFFRLEELETRTREFATTELDALEQENERVGLRAALGEIFVFSLLDFWEKQLL